MSQFEAWFCFSLSLLNHCLSWFLYAIIIYSSPRRYRRQLTSVVQVTGCWTTFYWWLWFHGHKSELWAKILIKAFYRTNLTMLHHYILVALIKCKALSSLVKSKVEKRWVKMLIKACHRSTFITLHYYYYYYLQKKNFVFTGTIKIDGQIQQIRFHKKTKYLSATYMKCIHRKSPYISCTFFHKIEAKNQGCCLSMDTSVFGGLKT